MAGPLLSHAVTKRAELVRKLVPNLLAALVATAACGQHSSPDTLMALRIRETVTFDGVLDEPCWQRALFIDNFRQRDPHQDSLATDRTEVAVVYDDLALWFGARLQVTEPERMQNKHMRRDFEWWTDDNFQFILSTFNDQRNGYLFVTNPNGARGDMLLSDGRMNLDWNGVWDVRTVCTPEGWTAEFRIPFSTLQFRKDSVHTWGLNFERNVRCRNEQVNWQGWGRNTGIENLGTAGWLAGLKDIGYTKRFELKPYGLAGTQYRPGAADETVGKLGGDLNINLSPTLKVNLTSNTDFAQVEVDRIPVNLTRFNLFYPEKREFFLEGKANYEFGLDNNNTVFYTRTIGIEQLTPVPVLGGVRVFGKEGRHNIGFLSLQTGRADLPGGEGASVPATNNTVLRYKADVGQQSYIGGILTSKFSSEVNTQVAGIDGGYTTSTLFGNKRLISRAHFAQRIAEGQPETGATAAGASLSYPNDLINADLTWSRVDRAFNPDLGFLARSDYELFQGTLNIEPRWFTDLGVRKVLFQPWDVQVYRTASTGRLESIFYTVSPAGVRMNSGDEVTVALSINYDRVDRAFVLSDDIVIDSGEYRFQSVGGTIASFRGRRFSFSLAPSAGTYYGGDRNSLSTSLKANFGRHFNLALDHTWNALRFDGIEGAAERRLTTQELAVYPTYAFNPRLTVSLFGQWNTLNDLVRLNLRLHWIPKIGTDLFLVLDESDTPSDGLDLRRPDSRSVVGKLVWRFVF
jgi:hypothetical protein